MEEREWPADVEYRGYTFVSNDIATYVWWDGDYIDAVHGLVYEDRLVRARKLVDEWLNAR